MKNNQQAPLFELRQVVATPSAIDALQQAGVSANTLLIRHHCGDWGDLCDEDIAINNDALTGGSRLFSAYQVTDILKVWVITEADRSVITLLLPEDY